MRSPLALIGACVLALAVPPAAYAVHGTAPAPSHISPPPASQAPAVPSPLIVADRAVGLELYLRARAASAWFAGIASTVSDAGASATGEGSGTTSPSSADTPAAPISSGGPWVCIANAETGGIAAMGPTYWTVFGMVVDIIEDYGTPAERAHVFGGTATLSEQLDIATRFAADHGFGGWGWLTRQKCGL